MYRFDHQSIASARRSRGISSAKICDSGLDVFGATVDSPICTTINKRHAGYHNERHAVSNSNDDASCSRRMAHHINVRWHVQCSLHSRQDLQRSQNGLSPLIVNGRNLFFERS